MLLDIKPLFDKYRNDDLSLEANAEQAKRTNVMGCYAASVGATEKRWRCTVPQ